MLIDAGENFEAFLIKSRILGVGLVDALEVGQARHVLKSDLPQADCANPGRPNGIGVNRITDLFDLNVQYIGKNLAPDVGLGASADDVNTTDLAADEFLNRLQQPDAY